MPEVPLVDYHGSITDRHGRYLRGPECTCTDCATMWAGFLADPERDLALWDPRWTLHDPDSGAVVLSHARPESFTTAPTG